MKNKEGFISMTLVYTFLIVFLFLMASILSTYTKKSDYLEKIDSKIKEEVKLDKSPLTGEKDTSIKAVILAANTVYADNVTSTYVTSATGIDFAAKSSLTNGQGLYTNNKTEDGKNYYFRGGTYCAYTDHTLETDTGPKCIAAGGTWDSTNKQCNLNLSRSACEAKGFIYYDLKNNVTFAAHKWRIIRIDEYDNIRMILADDVPPNCGSYNSARTDNAHVGYMFGSPIPSTTYDGAHTNTNNSTIKACVDAWYVSSLTSYSSSIADAGYCCDRSLNGSSLGYGTNTSYYSSYTRLVTTPKLSLNAWCSNSSRDLFTTTTNTNGNKKLANPIGLITFDELRYSGVVGSQSYTNYLKFNNDYWTMSPYMFSSPSAYNFYIDSRGMLGQTSSGVLYGRPVIALKPTMKIASGTGTVTDPYVVN